MADFYEKLIEQLKLKRALSVELPEDVPVQMRSDGDKIFLFVLNFSKEEKAMELGELSYQSLLTGETLQDK